MSYFREMLLSAPSSIYCHLLAKLDPSRSAKPQFSPAFIAHVISTPVYIYPYNVPSAHSDVP
jgi:hypothetical protein